MKKKVLLISASALAGLFTLASCGNSEELDNLKKEVEALKADNKSLSDDKESLSNENKNLKTDKENLTKANDTLTNEKNEAVSAKDIALAQIEELTSKNETLENENDNLNNTIDAITKEKDNLMNSISNYLKDNDKYAIKYTDPTGASTFNIYAPNVSLDYALTVDFDAVITNGTYGLQIDSINNYADPNWYVAIYENGEYSQVGFGDLVIDAGDVFEFKYECWNTIESGYGAFDSYDVLVDKAIYNYYVNVLPTKLASVTTYTGITYWDSLALYKLKTTQLYGSNAYSYDTTVNNPFSNDYVTALNEVNQSELSGNNLFKYYYADRLIANNRDYTDLKSKYQSYLDTLTEYSAWGEYANPFHTGVSKSLGLNVNDAIKTTAYRADTTYGTDGLSWELAGLACYNTLTKEDLSGLTFEALDSNSSKDVSLSAYILPYAASNISFRELKDSNDIDAIQYLFDNYYDLATMQFETEKLSTDISSNQIYAALVAYKIQRDTKNATNLFE